MTTLAAEATRPELVAMFALGVANLMFALVVLVAYIIVKGREK